MPKKPNNTFKKPKLHLSYSKQNIAIIALVVIIGAIILSIIYLGSILHYVWKVQEAESNVKISTLILQSVEGLSNPAPVDPQTGNVYIPQARLKLPANQDTIGAEVEYSYTPPQDDIPEELRIVNTYGFWSARSAMLGAQTVEGTFEQVPKLQACSRGYLISFNPLKNSADPLKFTKQLTDGRTLSVYLDAGCTASNDEFENYLKQIESF
jgi:hypothetical protein